MNRFGAATRYGIAIPLMLFAASCTAIPTPDAPPPAPQPVAAPPPSAPPPARPWDQRSLDSGAWRYDAGSRTASFVPTGSADPLVTLACSGAGIRLSAGLGSAGQPLDVALRTSAGTDRLRFDGTGTTLPARDPRLDRIAFSRGRFALEANNGSALTLPVQSEIGRVIEDCRG
jgi:hypothetical protein